MKQLVNIYTSTCCGVEATKPPCVKPRPLPKPKGKGKKGRMPTQRDGQEKKVEFATLGSWRCANCGKPCKVSVSPRPPKKAEEVSDGGQGTTA
jgi:hypothetical protein